MKGDPTKVKDPRELKFPKLGSETEQYFKEIWHATYVENCVIIVGPTHQNKHESSLYLPSQSQPLSKPPLHKIAKPFLY